MGLGTHIREIGPDIGFGPGKARRLVQLRARLRQVCHVQQKSGGTVYIRRGRSGQERGFLNEDEVIRALEQKGVTIVEAETDTQSMIEKLMEARILIGVEGSQLAHGVYTLADGGAILALQPPDRFYNPHREWT